jgi:predicted acyl esterase
MNILPHKSWHVYRKENVERVARDEREHRHKQELLRLKQLEIEQHARLQALRANARASNTEPTTTTATASSPSSPSSPEETTIHEDGDPVLAEGEALRKLLDGAALTVCVFDMIKYCGLSRYYKTTPIKHVNSITESRVIELRRNSCQETKRVNEKSARRQLDWTSA